MHLFTENMQQRYALGEANRFYLQYFTEKLGYIPNLISSMMHSKNALKSYYSFHQRDSSLSKLETEVVTLAVSSHNLAAYCQYEHRIIVRLFGLSELAIQQIESGKITFDNRLNIIVQLAISIVDTTNNPAKELIQAFFEAGYSKGQLMDLLMVVGDTLITNMTSKVFKIPRDQPLNF